MTTNFLYPTVGQTQFVPTLGTLTLLVTQTFGPPSYSKHLFSALYSCYLMKFLYNMILLPSFSSLQLATGTSCNKHSNWTVLSQSLHSKTQSWTLLLKVVVALCDVLLSLSSCPLCCFLCPIMFVPCFVLLPCCCHVLLPCFVVVLGLSLCSVVFVSPVVMCVLSYIYIFSFLIPAPIATGCL